jgi:tyrosyl-tRNA synthetase
MGILPGTDGVIRMSKSLGNHIALNTTPDDMYGKVMSVPDSAMGQYARLVTRWSPEEIGGYESDLERGELHPRDLKMRLAREIVGVYHGEEAAGAAEESFRTVFQDQGEPQDMPEYHIGPGQNVVDVMVAAGLADSKSEARRLIKQRAVRLESESLDDAYRILELRSSAVLRVGRRRFVRLLPPD